MPTAPNAPIDPAEARKNPRVGDVWRKGDEVRTVRAVTKSTIVYRYVFDGLDAEFGACRFRHLFLLWTQTAELIERGE